MKALITLVISIILCFHTFGQEKLAFEKVIKTDSVGKNKIYTELINWITENYKSTDKVIQVESKEDGLITVNGIIKYSPKKIAHLCYEGFINYSILFQIKDNRFKVELTNFTHSVKPGNSQSCELGLITDAEIISEKGLQKAANNQNWKDLKETINSFSNNILGSIETSVLKQLQTTDDW